MSVPELGPYLGKLTYFPLRLPSLGGPCPGDQLDGQQVDPADAIEPFFANARRTRRWEGDSTSDLNYAVQCRKITFVFPY